MVLIKPYVARQRALCSMGCTQSSAGALPPQSPAQFPVDVNVDAMNVDASHRIYAKTEPGGRIVFGELTGAHLDLLMESLSAHKISEELIKLSSDPPDSFTSVEGVSSACDQGNEGQPCCVAPVAVPQDADGCMVNGVYMACLRLSKVSIEFNFEPSDGAEYDPAKLAEITVPIELPGCVECRRYGVPEFGIVTGYEYAGEPLDEYDGDLCDRGYDITIAIFRVRDDDCELLYRRYEDEDGEVVEETRAQEGCR